jgi:hypothetical protein
VFAEISRIMDVDKLEFMVAAVINYCYEMQAVRQMLG